MKAGSNATFEHGTSDALALTVGGVSRPFGGPSMPLWKFEFGYGRVHGSVVGTVVVEGPADEIRVRRLGT